MMPRLIIILLACLALTSCTKEESPTNPFTPGKRNYVWTRDTLFYLGNAQTAMRSIYGSSPSNVYVVGHSEVSAGRIWHYNGANWQTVNLSSIRGYLNAISGSNENNIWIAGEQTFIDSSNQFIDSTLIVHYDGAGWTQITGFPRRGALECVAVYGANSVWAGGRGILYRLNENTWELYEVGWQYFISSIAAISPTECYAIGHVSDSAVPVDSSGSFLFRFDGIAWHKIDSVMDTPGAPPPHMGTGVYSSNGILYSIGSNVYRRSGNNWGKLVEALVGHMSQSHLQNIFAVGQPVIHFDGIDWKEIGELRSFGQPWLDCYADGSEVFILGNTSDKTIIVHGK